MGMPGAVTPGIRKEGVIMARHPKTTVREREQKVKDRSENALQAFLTLLEAGAFPETAASTTMLARASDAPSAKWSAGNQALMLACGTADARGYRQWQAAGRQVKKGAKAVYIFAPQVVTRTVEDPETGNEEKNTFVRGFTCTPVFRVEDTEGDPVPSYDPPKLPPLTEVAEVFGVSVEYAPSAGEWGGYYRHDTNEIVLCNHSERTFFHELAHAAHYRIEENAATQDSDRARKELVAETAAAALGRLYGYEYGRTSGQYLAYFAQSNGDSQTTLREVMRYIGEVRAVLDLILDTADAATQEAA